METIETHDHDYKTDMDNIEGKEKKKQSKMLNKKMLLWFWKKKWVHLS